MPFDPYLKKGLLKKQSPKFKKIAIQINRSKKDLETAKLVIGKDPEWGATIAYHAMLRIGRAFLFSHGYLPADGAQHKRLLNYVENCWTRDTKIQLINLSRCEESEIYFSMKQIPLEQRPTRMDLLKRLLNW